MTIKILFGVILLIALTIAIILDHRRRKYYNEYEKESERRWKKLLNGEE